MAVVTRSAARRAAASGTVANLTTALAPSAAPSSSTASQGTTSSSKSPVTYSDKHEADQGNLIDDILDDFDEYFSENLSTPLADSVGNTTSDTPLETKTVSSKNMSSLFEVDSLVASYHSQLEVAGQHQASDIQSDALDQTLNHKAISTGSETSRIGFLFQVMTMT